MKECSAYGASTQRSSNTATSLRLPNPGTEIAMMECSAYGASIQHSSNTTSLPNSGAEIAMNECTAYGASPSNNALYEEVF